MPDSVKQSAIIFKKRAKELGYEIKLTHCQEILAQINDHKTRHSYLLENKPNLSQGVDVFSDEKASLSPQDTISQFISHLIGKSQIFSHEELELIKFKKFQETIEKTFFENLVKTVASQIVRGNQAPIIKEKEIQDNKNCLQDEYIFDFNFKKGIINNIKNIVRKFDDSSYNFKKYLDNLETGKYRDIFFLGLNQKNNQVNENLVNYLSSPNSIFIGKRGSGKSVSNVFTTTTWMLANSNHSLLYIVGTLKGANEYSYMFKYNQVAPLIDTDLEF